MTPLLTPLTIFKTRSMIERADVTNRCGRGALLYFSEDGTQARVVPLFCKQWSCPNCGPILQARWKNRIADAKPERFLTLTCDPKLHTTYHAAYLAIKKAFRGLVVYLRKRGHTFEYAAIWEAQESGWPHLHVAQKGDFLPHGLIKKFWIDHHIGQIVDIKKVYSEGGVANYLAKYLTDAAGRSHFLPKGSRLITTSRGFFPDDPEPQLDLTSADAKPIYIPTRACDILSILFNDFGFVVIDNPETGDTCMARLDGPLTDQQRAALLRKLKSGP